MARHCRSAGRRAAGGEDVLAIADGRAQQRGSGPGQDAGFDVIDERETASAGRRMAKHGAVATSGSRHGWLLGQLSRRLDTPLEYAYSGSGIRYRQLVQTPRVKPFERNWLRETCYRRSNLSQRSADLDVQSHHRQFGPGCSSVDVLACAAHGTGVEYSATAGYSDRPLLQGSRP